MYFESVDKRHPGEHYVRLFDQVMLCNAAIERMETEMRELKSVFESEDEEADFSVIVSEAEDKAEGKRRGHRRRGQRRYRGGNHRREGRRQRPRTRPRSDNARRRAKALRLFLHKAIKFLAKRC